MSDTAGTGSDEGEGGASGDGRAPTPTAATTDGPAAAGGPRRRRPHHPWRWAGLAVAAVLVVAAGAVLVGYLVREQPEARSVDDALERLRRGSTTVVDDADGLPAPGVYTAAGRGTESISFPPASQEDGATIPMTVERREGDCFLFRSDYNEAHWTEWDLCRRDGALVLSANRNSQRWDFGSLVVENVGDFGCDPPSEWVPADAATGGADGRTTTATCSGTNSAVPGPTTTTDRTTVVGVEDLRIGGERVPAVHLSQVTELTGAQDGRNDVELWLHARTGLPLRMERTFTVATDSPVGTVTYTEEGEWELESTEPRR